MNYTIVKASTPEDQSRVEEFLDAHFFLDTPLIQTFGLDETPPPSSPSPPRPAQSPGDFSLMAIDSQGSIVAVAVNSVSVGHEIEPETPLQIEKMLEFLEWVKQDAKLETLPKNTIELYILSVHKEWRQRGVAKALTEESVRLARESGFQAMRVCCASEYVAKLVRGLGWRQHYRLRYGDYPSRARVDVKVTPDPHHEYIYYYVIDL